MLRLRQLSYADKDALTKYLQEWYVNGEPIVPSNTDMSRYESFESMVDRLNSTEVDEDWVPTTTLFCFEDEMIVGAVDIRHYLNQRLVNIGGHVGYGVCKSRRGQGIASLMLQVAKAFLKEIGVDKVLMTTNPKNVASQKVIKHSGGYEIESYVKKNGNLVSRFEIPND
ncbi:GNAT family N-acetyltransferase [Staphylococcus haemolyticus]|uniref:GNAT family N-acetyltransferase n=1 Tax=Staphylococcus haemolyticus TaxID=1283 RepID=UPI0020BF1203